MSASCSDCAHFIVINALDRCARIHMTDSDGNPTYGATAFQRSERGDCGPNAKHWEGRT